MGKSSPYAILFRLQSIFCFRSYVGEILNGSEILSGKVENAYFHFAAIQDRWDNRWASCLTFNPQHNVPPGERHSVTQHAKFLQKSKILMIKISDGHVP